MCFDEISKYVCSEESEEARNENVKTLFHNISNHVIETLSDLMNERLQHQGCAQSLRGVHLPASRSGFIASRCTPCLKDHLKELDFLHNKS